MEKMNRMDTVATAVERSFSDNSVVALVGKTTDLLYGDSKIARITNVIAKAAAEYDRPTVIYSLAGGIRSLVAKEGLAVSRLPQVGADDPPTISLDEMLQAVEQEGRPCEVIIDFAEGLIPCDGMAASSYDTTRIIEQIASRANDLNWQEQGHRFALISRAGSLNKNFLAMPGVSTIDVPLPDEKERLGAIERMLAHASYPFHLEHGLSPSRLARITGGMDLDSISRLRYASSVEKPLTRECVLEEKREVIRRQAGDSLELKDEKRTFDQLADLHNVKAYVRDMMGIGSRNLRLILAGPPGTGKTTSALAIANEIDAVPVFLTGQVLSKWVGESERNLSNVFRVIEGCGRVLLVIDEGDQGLLSKRANSASEESSSVYASLRGMIMTKTGDTGTPSDLSILVLTNNPGGIDNAIRNRMTMLPALEVSSMSDRAAIFELNAAEKGYTLEENAALQASSSYAESIDGRQIIRILDFARIRARKRGSEVINSEDILYAITHSHCSFGVAEQLASMRAIVDTYDDYLPWIAAWDSGISDYEIHSYLLPFVDSSTGCVDREKLKTHILDLEMTGC